MKSTVIILILLLDSSTTAGNTTIESFPKAKKYLHENVYSNHRLTIYCGAEFDSNKKVTPPPGFHTDKYKKRAERIEWEHVVPAENFGRTFVEWRLGDPQCVDQKGQKYKGRKCASKVSSEYRLMQSDMYNLYPAIGAVNALRSNYSFTMLPDADSDFGSCDMRIESKKAQPPIAARGRIARTYKYMDSTYSRYSMIGKQKKLMDIWDEMYPVSEWECERALKIEMIQSNSNTFVLDHCTFDHQTDTTFD